MLRIQKGQLTSHKSSKRRASENRPRRSLSSATLLASRTTSASVSRPLTRPGYVDERWPQFKKEKKKILQTPIKRAVSNCRNIHDERRSFPSCRKTAPTAIIRRCRPQVLIQMRLQTTRTSPVSRTMSQTPRSRQLSDPDSSTLKSLIVSDVCKYNTAKTHFRGFYTWSEATIHRKVIDLLFEYWKHKSKDKRKKTVLD